MAYGIGIDVGGTNVVVGLLDEQYRLRGKLKRPTEAKRGAEHVLGTMAAMVRELVEQQGVALQELQAVGAGIPGFIDPEQGVCRFAGNLGWRDLPVAELLQEQLDGLPVFIDNDVRAYTFGEAMAGAGRGFEVVFGLTLGTGLAAALVDRGRLYYGGGFMAGELGHIRMPGERTPCGCGMSGCLETIASATGIARIARERLAAGEASALRRMVSDLAILTSADVSRAYDAGDPLAIDVLTFVGTMLGRGLSYAIPLLSPDVIVIGGGAAQAGERLIAPMRAEIARQTLPLYTDRIAIRQAEQLDDAGIIGSAAFARQRIG